MARLCACACLIIGLLLSTMTCDILAKGVYGADGVRPAKPHNEKHDEENFHLHEASFTELDLDGDGFITRREMHLADYEKELPDHHKDQMMKHLDRDGEGKHKQS